jgi:hypothetical protein
LGTPAAPMTKHLLRITNLDDLGSEAYKVLLDTSGVHETELTVTAPNCGAEIRLMFTLYDLDAEPNPLAPARLVALPLVPRTLVADIVSDPEALSVLTVAVASEMTGASKFSRRTP